MKKRLPLTNVLILCCSFLQIVQAQKSPVQDIFPANTVTYSNIAYAGDTLQKHLLDIYLPANTTNNLPLIVWIHGGAWMMNDKYADMGYMTNTVKAFIDSGYALASIDYRFSTSAVFPAQIQDCNQAIDYLYQHAANYHIDKNRIALIGFSAGGHLASLLGLSNNNAVANFYANGNKPKFAIKAVLDFYGPSNLLMMAANADTTEDNNLSPIEILLGASPISRPDLAQQTSPVNYIDKKDPPFFIVQGEKDLSVPNTQSKLLSAWLGLQAVPNELIIVPNAPHYGTMFDVPAIRQPLFAFLRQHL
jgi:acetyl esterase/lipase